MISILIVEDDADLRESLALRLRRAGYDVREAPTASAALRLVGGADVMLSDIRLPDGDGIDLLVEARRTNGQLQVIMMTGHGTIPSAITAIQRGARAYLLKPFEIEELLQRLREAADVVEARRAAARAGDDELVGKSAAIQRVRADLASAASSGVPVLLEGETGTGKGLAAGMIHQRSPRAARPFVAINLSAIPRDLVESELFGHHKGAFTGAGARRLGRFALADGGTLFLDEINSLALDLQPKLLRALETSEIWPLGAEHPEQNDVRIIAATNAPLAQLVEEGRFRADLYYRLSVLTIRMPSLRERPEDVPLLARVLLDRAAKARGAASGGQVELTPEAQGRLIVQPWPGNVRELKNVIERALVRGSSPGAPCSRIDAADLDLPEEASASLPFKDAQAAAADEWSRGAVQAALRRSDGSVTEAAKLLKMHRSALFKLIRKLGIRT